jgi:NAD(P)-dependent dehydrogenase (short-subunit alcohol dehydrogenase family)
MMDLGLEGKAFLITGGTDGLGLALAKTLITEGARVGICGRDDSRLVNAQQELGEKALCVRADVTDAVQLDDFIDTVIDTFGRLDGAVNNAGRSSGSAVRDSSSDQWREDYELKVIAALQVARRVLPSLETTKGVILNVLAIMARTPQANSTPTTASRAAGLALTKAMANEVGPQGVRVNAILIGLIESGQWRRRAIDARLDIDDLYASMAKGSNIPMGRVGRAQEFADLAAFLLSSRASYITGVGIAIDGGLSPVI